MSNDTKTSHVGIGQQLPDLVLLDDQGNEVALRDLRGRRVVLYFYPKDDTPGCTIQACELRDAWSEFEAVDDLVVYGVSTDDTASHQQFRAKYALPFHLLVDEEHRLADAFGFWVEKVRDGRTVHRTERSTVIVAADGTVRAIARSVEPARHLEWLRGELDLG